MVGWIEGEPNKKYSWGGNGYHSSIPLDCLDLIEEVSNEA